MDPRCMTNFELNDYLEMNFEDKFQIIKTITHTGDKIYEPLKNL